VAQALWEVAERSAQQDPTFRTTLSFTRLEMIMNVKLTATQTKVIKAAAVHPHGNIEPLPANLRGGAKAAVINGLLARDLISKFHVQRSFRAPHMVSNAFLRRRQCLAAPGVTARLSQGAKCLDCRDYLSTNARSMT